MTRVKGVRMGEAVPTSDYQPSDGIALSRAAHRRTLADPQLMALLRHRVAELEHVDDPLLSREEFLARFPDRAGCPLDT